MNKERLIFLAALAAVFLGVFAVYHFYFAAKLARYAQHEELLATLRTSEASLKAAFGNEQPDNVIRKYEGNVEAWNEAIAARVPFFNDADWRIHEKPPQDVFILQFWYGDETLRVVTELWKKAQKKYGNEVLARMPEGFPNSVQAMLGVAYSESWQGKSIDAKLVNEQLERLQFGVAAFNLLMDNNALQISTIGIEDIGKAGFIPKGVDYTRIGLSFTMEMKDLVAFLEKLRLADSYYSVQGMRISHPYIQYKYEPRLQIDMYLLRAKAAEGFGEDGGGSGGAASAYDTTFGAATTDTAASTFGSGSTGIQLRRMDDDERGRAVREAPPGPVGRAWKWFKRKVLYTN